MIDAGDHGQRDAIGAYLLGALPEGEREEFERHLAGCDECRDEVARLRPAADLLPRSVEQLEPPASLKRSLMAVVESEAGESAAAERRSRGLGARLRDLFGPVRPAMVAAVLAAGLLIGIGVASLGDSPDSPDTRTIAASVDRERLADASGRLQLQGDGSDGAILRVQGMPPPGRDRVYQAWIQRDGMVTPQPTFEVGENGGAAVAVPDDLSDAAAVLVTREPAGGSRAPSEQPVLTVAL